MCRLNSTRAYYKASTQTPIKHKTLKMYTTTVNRQNTKVWQINLCLK